MRLALTLVLISFVAGVSAYRGPAAVIAQAPAQTPPPKPPAQTPPPKPAAQTPPPKAPAPAPKRPVSPTTTTLAVTVTDGRGAPIGNVEVAVSGPVTREGETDSNGLLRIQGLRSGTYRLRFTHDKYITLERDVTIPSRQPSMDQNVTLSAAPAAPPAPPPPPTPAPPTSPALPPPGKPVTMSIPDFIEKNFIPANTPQKTTPIGCSGLSATSLWQIREAWDRQHANSDATLYVIGGEGTLKLDGRDVSLQAGSIAIVPRGSAYALARRGRNPLILLATLAGEPCSP